jgi:geranylgeranyl diphosphate synthase type I
MHEELNQIRRAVDEQLTQILAEPRTVLGFDALDTPLASPLLDQVRELTLRGGKRIRAALVATGAALFRDETRPGPAVIQTACALELLHTYFLIHDDIMDDDDMRRGGPAVHIALAEQCADPRGGKALGILAGDLACALAENLIAGVPVEPESRQRLSRIFAAIHLDVVCGQTQELLALAPAVQVAQHKTASYTTAGPLALGAALAKAPDEQVEQLTALALPLGVAFQVKDDLIGAFGQTNETGKPRGSDLRQGTRNMLVEQGLQLAGESDREAISAALGKADASPIDIERACQALERCGARTACERYLGETIAAFIKGIEQGPYRPRGVEQLTGIARLIGERSQ